MARPRIPATPSSVARQALALALVAALPALAAWVWHPGVPAWNRSALEIALEEALALETAYWVDARVESAYRESRIPGALLVSEDDWEAGFERLLMEWDLVSPIVVYCSSQACLRSHQVAERLREDLAFTEVYALEGGWDAWIGAGEPTEP